MRSAIADIAPCAQQEPLCVYAHVYVCHEETQQEEKRKKNRARAHQYTGMCWFKLCTGAERRNEGACSCNTISGG